MKKCFALQLAVLLLVGMIPVVSFAVSITDAGTCGDNLTWTLNSEGLLTISGSGAMNHYESSGEGYTTAPWGGSAANAQRVKNVVMENGITSIGAYAFFNCANLTGVTLPNGLTHIGSCAFEGSGITDVMIPDSVTDIEYGTFLFCENLTNVSLPTGAELGEHVFIGTPWYTTFYNSQPDGPVYLASNCVGYKGSMPENTEIVFRNGTKRIESGAFTNLPNLTAVTFPDSLTTIGDGAFMSCLKLTAVTFPDSLTTIGYGAFANTGLTSVTIPDSVTTVDGRAFYPCPDLTDAILGNGITCIEAETFRESGNLSRITIPASVTYIEGDAFFGCGHLTDVFYMGTEEQWNAILVKDGNDDLLAANIHFGSHRHTPGAPAETVISPAGCVTAGEKKITVTCTECGDLLSETTAIIPAVGHTLSEPVETVTREPSCVQPGEKTIVTTCTVCGEVFVSQTSIPTSPHTDADKDGSCDACGTEVCRYCGKTHTGVLGGLTRFIHSLIYFFRNLFGKG